MPDPTYRAHTTASSSSTSLTPNKPTGTVDGDYMLACVTCVSSNSVSSAPSGWTLLYGPATFDDTVMRVYGKLASGEGASWTWTMSNSGVSLAIVVTIQDPDSASPLVFSGGQTNASSNNTTAPGGTTTEANATLVFFGAASGGFQSHTPPSGMTERGDVNNSNHCLEGATEVYVGPGSTGTRTATLAGGAQASAGWLGALQPAAPVAGGYPLYFGTT
jgi:hypothetical protein